MNLEGVHPDCFLKRINEISSDVCKPRLITCYHLKKKKKTKKHLFMKLYLPPKIRKKIGLGVLFLLNL